jgi:hypothetical protein
MTRPALLPLERIFLTKVSASMAFDEIPFSHVSYNYTHGSDVFPAFRFPLSLLFHVFSSSFSWRAGTWHFHLHFCFSTFGYRQDHRHFGEGGGLEITLFSLRSAKVKAVLLPSVDSHHFSQRPL